MSGGFYSTNWDNQDQSNAYTNQSYDPSAYQQSFDQSAYNPAQYGSGGASAYQPG